VEALASFFVFKNMKRISYTIIALVALVSIAGFVGVGSANAEQATLSQEEVALLRALLQRFNTSGLLTQPAPAANVPSRTEEVKPTPSFAKTPVCYLFSRDFGYGAGRTESEMKDVESLQAYLGSLGYTVDSSEMKAGGTFGETTAAGVVKFQGRYGITQTGFVGPRTRAALNSIRCVPASNPSDATVSPVAVTVPVSAPVQNVDNVGKVLTATLVSQSKDKVGIWDMFTSGRGNANSTKEDWEIKANLSLSAPKKISRITLTHPAAYEGWSTASADVYGRKPYPLGVYFASQPDVPLVTGYDQVIEMTSGVNTFLLYAQKETSWFRSAILVVTFTDGSTVSANVVGEGLPNTLPTTQVTPVPVQPSAPIAPVVVKPTPTIKLNKLPEKRELRSGDKLYWGWKTENFPVAQNGTDHISLYLVPVDGSERIRWAVNYWVHEPNQPQYTTISDRLLATSKIVGKEFRIRLECQSTNAVSKTCSDESKDTFIILPPTATASNGSVPQAAPAAITAIKAPVVTMTNPVAGSSLMKGVRYTFRSTSAQDLKDVVLTMKNVSTGQIVRTVKADIVAANSTFEWTIPSFFPDGEYRLEATAGGSRVEVVNATYKVVSPVTSSVMSVLESLLAFFE
jgi:peptidoglycan hydrolase-like protein with peptidoglycan-binding domain